MNLLRSDFKTATQSTAVGTIVGGVAAGLFVAGALVMTVLFKTGRLERRKRGTSSSHGAPAGGQTP